MAYIIAVCGAGGKSTLCKKIADSYFKLNKKVAVLTTTHMWYENEIDDIQENIVYDTNKVYHFGSIDGDKIGPVSQEEYKLICKKFDYIIVEADGSRMMPLKVSSPTEPVIPFGVNDIYITMGLHSIGREIGSVCHRYKEYGKKILGYHEDTKVTESIIDNIINTCYIKKIRDKYNNVKINVEKIDFRKSDNYKSIKKIALILCASGFSKRFGNTNKLFTKICVKDGKYNSDNIKTNALYKIMIDKLLDTKVRLIDKFHKELSYDDLDVDVSVVTQYEEILNDKDYSSDVVMIRNNNAKLGLSSSIKLAVERYRKYDAIMFLNADMPKLPTDEIVLFLYNSILSNNKISSMFNIDPKNPAYFENKYFDEIYAIDGDNGPRSLLIKHMIDSYKYHIADRYLCDIDTKDDLEALWN